MQIDLPEHIDQRLKIEQVLRKKRNKTDVVVDILKEYFEKRVNDFERLSKASDALLSITDKGD